MLIFQAIAAGVGSIVVLAGISILAVERFIRDGKAGMGALLVLGPVCLISGLLIGVGAILEMRNFWLPGVGIYLFGLLVAGIPLKERRR